MSSQLLSTSAQRDGADPGDKDNAQLPPILPTLLRLSQSFKKSGKEFDSDLVQLEIDSQSPPSDETEGSDEGSDEDSDEDSDDTDDTSQVVPASSATQAGDTANKSHFGQLYDRLSNRLCTQLFDKVLTKLNAKKLAGNLHAEVYKEQYRELYASAYKHCYHTLCIEFFFETCAKLNAELSKKILLDKVFCAHFYSDIYEVFLTKLHNDLYSRLYNQFYIPLYKQTTDSTDDADVPPQAPLTLDNDSDQQTDNPSILPIQSRQAFSLVKDTLPRQFSIPTITINKKKDAYAYVYKEHLFDPYTTPLLMLLFLSFSPDIMLPLSSLRGPLLESTLQLAEDTFYTHPNIDGPADLIPTMLQTIVCGRLSEIASRMYPSHIAWHQNQMFGRSIQRPPIPHLELGPNSKMQSVVEDSMVAYNPIKALISFLRAMVDKYRSLDLPMEQDDLADILLDETATHWFSSASVLSYTYGLFLWDSSKWVSDAEWDALVQYMTVITTEIFPNAYDRILGIESKNYDYFRPTGGEISSCDEALNGFMKSVLLFVTPCFLYHYRPMNKQVIPRLGPYWVVPYEHYFTAPAYANALKAFPTILHSCTIEYMQDPSEFERLPTDLFPRFTVAGMMARCSQFLTGVCFKMKELDCDEYQALRWKMPLRRYDDTHEPAAHLIDCVLRHPPVNDPVYQRIASIFPKPMKMSNLLAGYGTDKEADPQYTCPPGSFRAKRAEQGK